MAIIDDFQKLNNGDVVEDGWFNQAFFYNPFVKKGDESDGSSTISSDTSLGCVTKNYTSLTIDATKTLDVDDGSTIMVSGTLTINGTLKINTITDSGGDGDEDGGDGGDTAGRVFIFADTVAGSGSITANGDAGSAGSTATHNSDPTSNGEVGTTGKIFGIKTITGGDGGGPNKTGADAGTTFDIFNNINYPLFALDTIGAGSGGGAYGNLPSVGQGQGGGGGAGATFVGAGGAGGTGESTGSTDNNGAGGGGGGAGGLILLICNTNSSTITISATGGAGGAGDITGKDGGNGGGGSGGFVVTYADATFGSATVTAGAAGSGGQGGSAGGVGLHIEELS